MKSPVAMVLLLALLTAPALGEEGFPLTKDTFPPAWKITRDEEVDRKHLPAFSSRLGGQIEEVRNVILDAGGIRLQINLLSSPGPAEAGKVFRKLLRFRRNPLFVGIRGPTVVEFVCPNQLVVKKARHCLSLHAENLLWWSVTLTLAPIQSGDYSHFNPLFNDLLRLERAPGDIKAREAVVRRARHFTFYDTLVFYTLPVKKHAAVVTGTVPIKTVTPRGPTTAYTFESLPRQWGIPKVSVKARIPVQAFGTRAPADLKAAARLTGPTPAWPVKDQRIAFLVRCLFDDAPPHPSARVDAILACLHRHLRYGGPTGTRLGVHEALRKGTGRCWDFSDVFITLCRAAGVPARQVYGWLFTSGHVWAEVLLNNRWLPVDPTTTWTGVSDDYIPFAVSDEGNMPLLYWKMPVMKREG